jgi:putative lipoic acid-binding regulatory protein
MSAEDQSPLAFPCEFPVKAMGRGVVGFEYTVLEIVQRHAPEAGEDALKLAPSRNEKYLSVTVTITAHSREQLDRIYMDLTDHPDILMAL